MRDPVNADRISAYLDGELLNDDERKLVEKQLAESEEHQQLLKELEGVRADLQSQAEPRHFAPADFQSRVMAQIEESKVESAAATSVAGRFAAWKGFVAIAASLAVVAIVVVIAFDPAVAEKEPPAHLRERAKPRITLVYDVTITPTGQENQSFEKILKQLQIGLDPTMKMPADLERDLLEIRQVGKTNDTELVPLKKVPAENEKAAEKAKKDGDDDKVEMIYISSTNAVFDQFYMKLQTLKNAGQDVSKLKLSLIQEDRQLEVMRKLHDSALDHFVQSTPHGPADVGYAFKLTFRVRLNSGSVPGVASFSMSRFEALLDGDASSKAKSSKTKAQQRDTKKRIAQDQKNVAAADEAEEAVDPGAQPAHVLVIVRKAGVKAE